MTHLGDVCVKIGSGATPRGGKDAYCGGDYVLIRSQNVLDRNFSDTGLARINADQASKLDSVAVMAGDVLLNITGDSVARACIVPSYIKNARVNQHVCIVRPKPNELDSTYALMELQNKKSALLQIASSGATRNALTKHAIETLDLDLPSYDEQKRISVLVNNINQQIDCLNRTNGYLLELLMTEYRKIFGNLEPNGTIADLGDVVGGATPSKKNESFFTASGIAWITPRDLSGTTNVFIEHGATDITQEGFDSCSTRIMPQGSVLFSSRAPVGYVAIASNKVCTNQGFKSVVPCPEVGTAFVYCFEVERRRN